MENERTVVAEKPVWGVKAIAALIDRTERQTYHILENGHLPAAKKIGKQWTGMPSKILRSFHGEDAA